MSNKQSLDLQHKTSEELAESIEQDALNRAKIFIDQNDKLQKEINKK